MKSISEIKKNDRANVKKPNKKREKKENEMEIVFNKKVNEMGGGAWS